MRTASTPLASLLAACLGEARRNELMQLMHIPDLFLNGIDAGTGHGVVSRAELAFALNMMLFRDLLERVPEGKAYTQDTLAAGGRVFFDHGAVRTVALPQCGALPGGEASLTRVLLPLGYRLNDTYPLPRLKMTGRSYVHDDLPEEMPQFFVSELHVDQFSPAFQQAAERVVADTTDPLDAVHHDLLQKLAAERALPWGDALTLLTALFRCFDRQHGAPALSDYETLQAESQEMAWIATEGNAFNHVTDRVPQVEKLRDEQERLGRSIKPNVEVAARGSVRQTAYRAAQVDRVFRTEQGCVLRRVPGSFYEFISRDSVEDAQEGKRLDLGFDSGNATAIFQMTAAAS